MQDFSIRMINQVRFSNCEAPWQPTTKARKEMLVVELRGDVLTMTELRTDGSLGRRIYAQRSIELAAAMTFVILPRLPSRKRDGSFFPALGTLVLFAAVDGEKRRLRAVGTDTDASSPHCRGWIFDAHEE